MTTAHAAAGEAVAYDQSTFKSHELVAEGWPAYSVIAVSFEDDPNAYNALTVPKELDSQRRVGVQEAAVVVRGEDRRVVEKDRVESIFLPNTAGGAGGDLEYRPGRAYLAAGCGD